MCVLRVSMRESEYIQDCRKFHLFTANTHARLPDSIYATAVRTSTELRTAGRTDADTGSSVGPTIITACSYVNVSSATSESYVTSHLASTAHLDPVDDERTEKNTPYDSAVWDRLE